MGFVKGVRDLLWKSKGYDSSSFNK